MSAVAQLRAAPAAETVVALIGRAMADPAIPLDRLRALLDFHSQQTQQAAQQAFAAAMARAQAEIGPVVRDAANSATGSRYARLPAIDAMVRPIAARHGFSLEFDSAPAEDGRIRVTLEVSHEGGHSKLRELTARPDMLGPRGTPNKTELHGLSSTITTARRLLTCMAFNVVLADEEAPPPPSVMPPARAAALHELRELIADCSRDRTAVAANERAFLHRMGLAALRGLGDVPHAELPRLRTALLAKKALLAERAGAAP